MDCPEVFRKQIWCATQLKLDEHFRERLSRNVADETSHHLSNLVRSLIIKFCYLIRLFDLQAQEESDNLEAKTERLTSAGQILETVSKTLSTSVCNAITETISTLTVNQVYKTQILDYLELCKPTS